MLKAILYLSFTLFGICSTFVDPFYGVLTCLAAYLLNPTVLSMTDGDFRYQFWTTSALLLSVILHRSRRPAETGSEVWCMRLMWSFVIFAALTSTWAVVSASIALQTVYEVLKTVLLVALMVRLVRTERQMTMMVNLFIIGAFHAAVLHVLGTRWGYVPSSFAREMGVLPDSQTAVMVLFVPLLLLLAVFGTRMQRLLCWCALPFVLDSIIGTYERTGFVALLAEVLLLLIYLPTRITFRALPALVVGAGLFAFYFTPPDYWTKMRTIEDPTEEASANSRFIINGASERMFLDYPMGVGYRNYPYVSPRYLPDDVLTSVGDQRLRSAHNSYFTILCETGVIGFVIWMSMFVFALVLFRRLRKQGKGKSISVLAIYGMAFEVGLYGWAMGGWTQAYHEVDPAYWFVGCAVILIRLQRARYRAEEGEVMEVGEALSQSA
jgi:O-antigen ligase